MNQKQLANVLIKILGLSFGVDGIIRIVSGVINIVATLATRFSTGSAYVWVTPFTGLVLALIGFLLIVSSRAVADIMFRDE